MTSIQPAGGENGGATMARPNSSGLADVIDTILDKDLVIDAFVRISLVGIELVTVDARIVVADVDTYLRFVEAVESAAKHKTSSALDSAAEKILGFLDDVSEQRRSTSRTKRRQQ